MRQIVVDKKDRLARPVKRRRKASKAASGQMVGSQRGDKKSVSDMITSFLKLRLGGSDSDNGGLTKIGKGRGKQRRKPKPLWFRPAIYMALLAMTLIPVGYLGYRAIEMDLPEKAGRWLSEKFDERATNLGLSVQEISVKGRDRTGRGELMKALNVSRGDNIFRFDPIAARARIENLGWVETAMVKRNLPDQIFINVTERRPFVRWQSKGAVVLVDRRGFVITQSKSEQAEFSYLPKVVGKNANIEAADLFDLMSATPRLFTRIRNAVRIRDRRWNIEFENDVTVLLPENGIAKAWQKLSDLQEKNNILGKDLVSIDLRSDDKVYVRLSPGAAALLRDQGKET